jgi:uncharacterized protein (TIGR03382 family)
MRWLAAAVVLLSAGTASAHIALNYPAPRTSAQKAGPCGAAGSARGDKVTTFEPGQTIVVEWDETVDHPGHYRIAFDDDGDDAFVNPNNPNDNFAFTLVEPIADKSGGHYTQEVTLPNITCDNCTLQLMQVMTTSIPYNSFYWQCADITLVVGGGTDDGDPPREDGGCAAGHGGGLALALLALAVIQRVRPRPSTGRER